MSLPVLVPSPDLNASGYHLVIFQLDQQVYGLAIERVVQIISMVKITQLPQLGSPFEGVVNVHGKMTPVINVRKSLGLPAIPWRLYTPIILTQLRGSQTGLIVDEVLDVQSFTTDQVVSMPEIMPEWSKSIPVLEGLVYLHDLTILMINPDHLIKPIEIQSVINMLPENPPPKMEEGEKQQANQIAEIPDAPQPIDETTLDLSSSVAKEQMEGAEHQTKTEELVIVDLPVTNEPSGPVEAPENGNKGGKRHVDHNKPDVKNRIIQHLMDLGSDMPPIDG